MWLNTHPPVCISCCYSIDDTLKALSLLNGDLSEVSGFCEDGRVEVSIDCHCQDLYGRPRWTVTIIHLDADLQGTW